MSVIFPAAVLIASTFTILFVAQVADRRTDRRALSRRRRRSPTPKFDAAIAAATMRGLHPGH